MLYVKKILNVCIVGESEKYIKNINRSAISVVILGEYILFSLCLCFPALFKMNLYCV